MKGPLPLRKVISGGQTGADQAGLRAACQLGLETGGTAPPGWATSEGPKRDLLLSYGLVECAEGRSSSTAGYIARSKCNVDDADATLVFRVQASAGSDRTVEYCLSKRWKTPTFSLGNADFVSNTLGHRPVLIVQHMTPAAVEAVREFLSERGVRTLNVAGHRAVEGVPGWPQAVEEFLIKALRVA